MLKAGCVAPHGPDTIPFLVEAAVCPGGITACGTKREDRLPRPVPGGHESQFVRQVRLEEDGNVPGKQDGDELADPEREESGLHSVRTDSALQGLPPL